MSARNGSLLSCGGRRIVASIDDLFSDALRSVVHRICCCGSKERFEFADGALRARQKLGDQSGTFWQTRWILKRNDLFKGSQELSKFEAGLPLRKDHRGKPVLDGGDGADDPHHFFGAQTHDGDSKLVGEIAKRIEKALLFCGGADFGEVHFVERQDTDLNFRQRIEKEHQLFLRRGRGAEFLAELQ